jgi:hypothetical protein
MADQRRQLSASRRFERSARARNNSQDERIRLWEYFGWQEEVLTSPGSCTVSRGSSATATQDTNVECVGSCKRKSASAKNVSLRARECG